MSLSDGKPRPVPREKLRLPFYAIGGAYM